MPMSAKAKQAVTTLSSGGRVPALAVAELFVAFHGMKDALKILTKSVQQMNKVHAENEEKMKSFERCDSQKGEKIVAEDEESKPKKKNMTERVEPKKRKHASHAASGKSAKKKKSSIDTSLKEPTPIQETSQEKVSSVKKIVRCMKCKPCLKKDCGKCKNCKRKKKFGGKGTTKVCIHRNCKKLKTVVVTTKKPADKNLGKKRKTAQTPTSKKNSQVELRKKTPIPPLPEPGKDMKLQEDPPQMITEEKESLLSINSVNATSRRILTRQLLRCASFIEENLEKCEALLSASYPERKLANNAIKKSINVADLLGEQRYRAQAVQDGIEMATHNGQQEIAFANISKPQISRNGAPQFTPEEAVKIIAHNNLSDADCNFIVDMWIKEKCIPMKREPFMQLVEKYYCGNLNASSWESLMLTPLVLPIDNSENGWSSEDITGLKNCIADVNGVLAVEMDVTKVLNHKQHRYSTRRHTTDAGKEAVDKFLNYLWVDKQDFSKDTASLKSMAMTGLDALAAGATMSQQLLTDSGNLSVQPSDNDPVGNLNDCILSPVKKASADLKNCEMITVEEAMRNPHYKSILISNERRSGITPAEGKDEFSPIEAIAYYMRLNDVNKETRIWQEKKFVPIDQKSFEELIIAFYENEPIPTTWCSDWSKLSEHRKQEVYQKELSAALRLIKEGYVPVPLPPKREFTPTEVAVILCNIEKSLKNRVVEIWLKCKFVPVNEKRLSGMALKFERGLKLPDKFKSIGRPSFRTIQNARYRRSNIIKTLTGSNKSSSLLGKTKELSFSERASASKMQKPIEKKIEKFEIPVPPNNRPQFTPLEAVQVYKTLPNGVREDVRKKWRELKYIPHSKTSFNRLVKKHKQGLEIPLEWSHSMGRPAKLNIDQIIEWAVSVSTSKGRQITIEEFKAKIQNDGKSLAKRTITTYWECIKATLDSDPSLSIPEPSFDIPETNGQKNATARVYNNFNEDVGHFIHTFEVPPRDHDISHDDIQGFM